MRITIDLLSEHEAHIREKAAQEGKSSEEIARNYIVGALEWEARDRAEALEGIRRGLEAAESGRARPLKDFIADQRRKYGYPDSWPYSQDD